MADPLLRRLQALFFFLQAVCLAGAFQFHTLSHYRRGGNIGLRRASAPPWPVWSTKHVCLRTRERVFRATCMSSRVSVEQDMSIWSDEWYPLHFEHMADKETPQKCTILGAEVVFWHDHSEWRALIDQCPHRLVPLSEGRICPATGDIECPYHGWTFQGSDGTCTRIPQLDPDQDINQNRSQAQVLPVVVRDGIIWMWAAKLLGSSVEPDVKKLERLLVDAIGRPGVLHVDYFRDLYMDATILTENVLDPSHLPFTHHSTISKRQRAGPLPLTLQGQIESSGFDASKSTGKSLGQSTNTTSGGSVTFKAPHHVLSVTERPGSFSDWNVVYAVPQAPGRSRVFVRVVFEVSAMPSPLNWIFKVSFRLPEALLHLNNHKILEDDNIFLHAQDLALRHNPKIAPDPGADLGDASEDSTKIPKPPLAPDWQRRLYLPSKADSLVVAYRVWLDRYTNGNGAPWSPFFGVASGEGRGRGGGLRRQGREELLERLESHTALCACCAKARGGALTVERWGKVAIPCLLFAALVAGPGMPRIAAAAAGVAYVLAMGVASLFISETQTGLYPPPRNRKA